MLLRTGSLRCIFLTPLFMVLQLVACSYHERRLYEDLMKDYNNLERPVLNHSQPVVVCWFAYFNSFPKILVPKKLYSYASDIARWGHLEYRFLKFLNCNWSEKIFCSWKSVHLLQVYLKVSLQQIIDVDEKNQIVYVNAWLDFVSNFRPLFQVLIQQHSQIFWGIWAFDKHSGAFGKLHRRFNNF